MYNEGGIIKMSLKEDYEELEKSYSKFLDQLFQLYKNHNDKLYSLESSIIRLQTETIGNSMKSIRNVLGIYITRKHDIDDKRRNIE